MICFVCGKEVKEEDEYIWFGCNGDKIHKSCEKNIEKAKEAINNMTDEEFCKYLLGN